MDASDYKDEETTFPNLHAVDKTKGTFKDLLKVCKKVKEEEIQGFIDNTEKIRENEDGYKEMDGIHGDLSQQQIFTDDEEDFV